MSSTPQTRFSRLNTAELTEVEEMSAVPLINNNNSPSGIQHFDDDNLVGGGGVNLEIDDEIDDNNDGAMTPSARPAGPTVSPTRRQRKSRKGKQNNNNNNTDENTTSPFNQNLHGSSLSLLTRTDYHHHNNNSNNSNDGGDAANKNQNSNGGSNKRKGESGLPKTLEALLLANPNAESGLKEATSILVTETRAKNFRSKLRYALAALAILNFIQTIIFFFLVAPPGMGQDGFQNQLIGGGKHGGYDNETASRIRQGWNLFSEIGESHHQEIFLAEGSIQLLLTILSEFVFFLQYLSRNPQVFPALFPFVKRNAGNRHAGFDKGEVAEAIVWLIHCPIGLAELNPRLRYINGICVFRLYVVVQAGMQMTDFGNTMMRTMSNFFDLRLSAGVFIRWSLEFHKWKVLISSFLFLWAFMALTFSFAEGLGWLTSMWFIISTMSTAGYGDVFPLTNAGRLVAIVSMAIGLIVLAYIVSQVQQLTTRTPHEQKVLDALRVSKLQGEAKIAAAKILYEKYRSRKNNRTNGESASFSWSDKERKESKSKIESNQKKLRSALNEMRLLPPVFDQKEEAMNEVRENVRDMKKIQLEQQEMIRELSKVVQQQQQMLSELLSKK